MPAGPPFAVPADYAQSLNGGGVDLSGTQPADGVLRSPFMQLKLKRTRVTDRLEPLEHEHLRVSDEDTANRALVAAPGHRLVVAQLDTADGFDGYTKAGALGVFFDIQNSSTYTLVLPGGQQIRARAGKDSTTTFGGTYSSATPVMFDVPDSLRTATLHIAPSGTVEAVQRDVRYASSWAKAPAAQDFPIDLG